MTDQGLTVHQEIAPMLSRAVDRVLETMFFTSPLGPARAETGGAVVQVCLAFHGRPSGTLRMCLSEASARVLAADFLGEDQETITNSAPDQVVCELANMVCGSLVTSLEGDTRFDLGSPQPIPIEEMDPALRDIPPSVQQSYELENGVLTIVLHLETLA